MKRTMLALTITITGLWLGTVLASPAIANTYDVYSCWAGYGTFRNPSASGAAWTKVGFPDRYAPGDDCGRNSQRGSMSVVSISGYPSANGQFGELAFLAPAGLSLTNVRLWRVAWSYGTGSAGASQRNYLAALTDGSAFSLDADGGSDAPAGSRGLGDLGEHGIVPGNLLDLSLSARAPHGFSYRVGCGFASGCPTGISSGPAPNFYAAGVEVFGAIVTLRDTQSPSLDVAEAGLLDGGEQAGRERVLVSSAGDTTGIKRLAVYADDAPTPLGVVDFEKDLNRCDWSKVVPCQNASDVEIPVDTRELADGRHSVVVRAFDAADNQRTSTTRTVAVRNGGAGASGDVGHGGAAPSNGAGTPRGARLNVYFVRNRRTATRAKYGTNVVVRGVLRDRQRAPISGAQVEYSVVLANKGAKSVRLGAVRTDATGEFLLTVPTRFGSRRLRFSYRSQPGGAVETGSAVHLYVPAALKLHIRPRHVRNMHGVVFRGRVLSGAIPRKGKLIDLQVAIAGKWHTFATLRSARIGTFRFHYRFQRTYSRVTYRFRALSRYEPSYPFAAGSSRTVKVKVN